MIGIQFGVYEAMKNIMLQRSLDIEASASPQMKTKKKNKKSKLLIERYGTEEAIEEAAMETAASQGTPFPAPHFLKYVPKASKKGLQSIFGSRIRNE